MKTYLKITLFYLLWAGGIQAQAPFSTPDNIGTGNCLSFDGSNDYVSVPDDASLDMTSALTIESWIYAHAVNPNDVIIIKNVGNSSLSGFLYGVDGAPGNIKYNFGVGQGAGQSATVKSVNSVVLNEWHHITGVYDGTNIMLYVDGELIATKGVAGLAANNASLIFGSFLANGDYFDGLVDEIRIWNVARTQAQIKDNMCKKLTGSETGLVGYWDMNEGTGNTVGDLTSNGNDGTRQ